MSKTSERRVVSYTACPCCSCWSLGVQANGRIVRHSMGWGSVERCKPPFVPAPICSGSGRFVNEAVEATGGE